jgi:hypothetical protein
MPFKPSLLRIRVGSTSRMSHVLPYKLCIYLTRLRESQYSNVEVESSQDVSPGSNTLNRARYR